jgi:putative flippase GtrA
VRWHPVPAAVVGYLVGGVLQYILCASWVFPTAPQNFAAGYLSSLALSLVGLGITGVTIAVLHDFAHVNYAIAKVVSLAFSFAWNFASRKVLIFKAEFEHTAASAPSARVPSPRMAFRRPAPSHD